MELKVLFLFVFISFVCILSDEMKICNQRKNYQISYYGYLKGRLMNSCYVSYIKRIFDFYLSLAVVIFVLPILYLILGSIIKLTSRGPIFFIQPRVGMFGKPFLCLKFRSMYQNASSETAVKNDVRVTPIGRFMRKSHLDEFPQFINVLFGDMSIVGPRPLPETHLEEQKPRLLVRPGITGLAQITLGRGYSFSEKFSQDVNYLEKLTIKTDFKIILKTLCFKDNSY